MSASKQAAWSTTGLGIIDTTGLYTAPAVVPQTGAALAGCLIYPTSNVWNTPIDSLPIDTHNDLYIDAMSSTAGIHFGRDFTMVYVSESTAGLPVDFLGGYGGDGGRYKVPIETPVEDGDRIGSDRHVIAFDYTNCLSYELFGAYPRDNNTWHATAGAIYDYKTNTFHDSNTGIQASGMPMLPGLLKPEDIQFGDLSHALEVKAPGGSISGINYPRNFVWPAQGASRTSSQTGPPFGTRFRIKASFDESGFTVGAQRIIRGLKKYGAILGDVTSAGQYWWIDATAGDWDSIVTELAKIQGSNWEAVDVSSIRLNSDIRQGQTRHSTDLVTAKSQTNPSDLARATIALNAFPLAVSPNNIIITAGQTQQFTVMKGAPVRWSVSGEGSIDAESGLYTAPAAVGSTPLIVTVTAASALDSGQVAYAKLTVAPDSGFHAIRIVSRLPKGQSSFADSKKQTWLLPRQGDPYGGGVTYLDNGTGYDTGYNSTQNTNDPLLYASLLYTWSRPQKWTFPVPNGTYLVRLSGAENAGAEASTLGSTSQRSFDVAINGVPVLKDFSYVYAAGDNHRAITKSFRVSVQKGHIQILITPRRGSAFVNTVEILADSEVTPSVRVTPASNVLTFAPGQQYLFAADVEGLNPGIVWSAQKGTIAVNGLYTAPSTIAATMTDTITARSADDASMLGTTTVNLQPIPGGAFPPIRILCGNRTNGPYTDSAGNYWAQDQNYDGGFSWSNGNTISGTADPTIYSMELYSYKTTHYRFNVANGNYHITLKWADNAKPGDRVFDVVLNGKVVLPNFDVVATGGVLAAVDRSFTLAVSDNMIDIAIIPHLDSQSAILSGIQIVGAPGPGMAISPGSVRIVPYQLTQFSAAVLGQSDQAVTWRVTSGPGSISKSGLYTPPVAVSAATQAVIEAASVSNPSVSGTVTISLLPGRVTDMPPIRIKCGYLSGTLTDSQGNMWQADRYFSGGLVYYSAFPAIAGTNDLQLYNWFRITTHTPGDSFSYTIPMIPNGTYSVRLLLAEQGSAVPGIRRFNVSLNGQTVLSDFDIAVRCGVETVCDQTFLTMVSNSTLTVRVTAGNDNSAILQGLQVALTGGTQ